MDPSVRFKEYIQSLKKKDKIAILHHTDADGICAGIIAKKSIEKITGAKISIHFHQPEGKITIIPETIGFVKSKGITHLIVVDMAIDHDPVPVKELEKHAKILLIDHHIKANDISSENIAVVKAADLSSSVSPDKYPASKMCYDLFSEIIDIHELRWLASVGIYGDYAQSQWSEFIAETMKETGITEKKLKSVEELIFYSSSIRGTDCLKDAFDIISEAKSIDYILESRLKGYKKKVEGELKKYLRVHKAKAEFQDSLIIYEISPKHRIKSRLINILSQEYYPDKTIVLLQLEGARAYISARRQDCLLSMNDMLKRTLSGIPDSEGGGHVPAAGGYLPKSQIVEFKRRVVSYCKEKEFKSES